MADRSLRSSDVPECPAENIQAFFDRDVDHEIVRVRIIRRSCSPIGLIALKRNPFDELRGRSKRSLVYAHPVNRLSAEESLFPCGHPIKNRALGVLLSSRFLWIWKSAAADG